MTTTPERQPRMGDVPGASIAITEAQKQALIENLQLEVTERARKLRAQYALQAQGLRTRLEMRVNRIPQALRKVNMQELVDKYSEASKPVRAPVASPKPITKQMSSSPVMTRGVKRSSDVFSSADKENANPSAALENPKKRAKTTAPMSAATSTQAKAGRVPSRKPVPGQVLSPKSQNSRTYPQSPLKPAVPPKSFVPKPASPAKPILTGPAKQTRPASRTIKKAPVVATTVKPAAEKPATRKRGSSASDSTTVTTVVKKQPAPSTTTAAAKKAAAASAAIPAPAPPSATTAAPKTKKTGTIKSAIQSLTGSKRGKAATAAKAEAAAAVEPAKATTIGGRTLRKRG